MAFNTKNSPALTFVYLIFSLAARTGAFWELCLERQAFPNPFVMMMKEITRTLNLSWVEASASALPATLPTLVIEQGAAI